MKWIDLFKKEEVKVEPVRWRITKEAWPDGRESFSIETFDTWLGDVAFWHGVYLPACRPNTFKTHKEASDYLTEMLKPPVRPVITVVEER